MLRLVQSIRRRQAHHSFRKILRNRRHCSAAPIEHKCHRAFSNPMCRKCYIGTRDFVRLVCVVCPFAVVPTIEHMISPRKTRCVRQRQCRSSQHRYIGWRDTACAHDVVNNGYARRPHDVIKPYAVFASVGVVDIILAICPTNLVWSVACYVKNNIDPICLPANGDTNKYIVIQSPFCLSIDR